MYINQTEIEMMRKARIMNCHSSRKKTAQHIETHEFIKLDRRTTGWDMSFHWISINSLMYYIRKIVWIILCHLITLFVCEIQIWAFPSSISIWIIIQMKIHLENAMNTKRILLNKENVYIFSSIWTVSS